MEYWFIGATIGALVGGGACYAFASRKNLATTTWLLIGLAAGFAFGIIGAVVAMVIVATRKEQRPCPRCAVPIPVDSTVCPRCWLQLVPAYGPAGYPGGPAGYPPYGGPQPMTQQFPPAQSYPPAEPPYPYVPAQPPYPYPPADSGYPSAANPPAVDGSATDVPPADNQSQQTSQQDRV